VLVDCDGMRWDGIGGGCECMVGVCSGGRCRGGRSRGFDSHQVKCALHLLFSVAASLLFSVL
jgi:hypothetical protein